MKSLVFALAVVGGTAVWFSAQSNSQNLSRSSRFITATLDRGEVRRLISATGTLNATVNVEVGSQLSGQVAEVLVDFNDRVTKGQPLARLDQRSFKARVDEARAAVEVGKIGVVAARGKVERAEIDVRDAEAQRAVLKARTENAAIAADAAQVVLHRREKLQSQGVGAAADVEEVRSRAAASASTLREAQALEAVHEQKVSASQVDFRRAQAELDTALALVPQKEPLLQIALIELERTTIRSPVNGVVVGRNVNEGQTLATTLEAKTVFIVAGDLQEMEIHAKVDEADIGKIQTGQEAVFSVDAYPERHFTARVRQLRKAPQVQQNVVTYTVVLTAANPDSLLLPGMTALVRILVSRTGPVLRMPQAALRFTPRDSGGAEMQAEVKEGKPASVWIVGQEGEPKGVAIGLGVDDASHAAVLSGPLQESDAVIVGEVPTASPKRLFGIRFGL